MKLALTILLVGTAGMAGADSVGRLGHQKLPPPEPPDTHLIHHIHHYLPSLRSSLRFLYGNDYDAGGEVGNTIRNLRHHDADVAGGAGDPNDTNHYPAATRGGDFAVTDARRLDDPSAICGPGVGYSVYENGLAVGGSSTNGDYSCPQTDDGTGCCYDSTDVDDPCSQFTGTVCHDHSCIGQYACYGTGSRSGSVGVISNSCVGSHACHYAAEYHGTVGNIKDSCLEDYSCYTLAFHAGTVGDITQSCVGEHACEYAGRSGIIGDITGGSCLGSSACNTLGGTLAAPSGTCLPGHSSFPSCLPGGSVGTISGNSCIGNASCGQAGFDGGSVGDITSSCGKSRACSNIADSDGDNIGNLDSCCNDSDDQCREFDEDADFEGHCSAAIPEPSHNGHRCRAPTLDLEPSCNTGTPTQYHSIAQSFSPIKSTGSSDTEIMLDSIGIWAQAHPSANTKYRLEIWSGGDPNSGAAEQLRSSSPVDIPAGASLDRYVFDLHQPGQVMDSSKTYTWKLVKLHTSNDHASFLECSGGGGGGGYYLNTVDDTWAQTTKEFSFDTYVAECGKSPIGAPEFTLLEDDTEEDDTLQFSIPIELDGYYDLAILSEDCMDPVAGITFDFDGYTGTVADDIVIDSDTDPSADLFIDGFVNIDFNAAELNIVPEDQDQIGLVKFCLVVAYFGETDPAMTNAFHHTSLQTVAASASIFTARYDVDFNFNNNNEYEIMGFSGFDSQIPDYEFASDGLTYMNAYLCDAGWNDISGSNADAPILAYTPVRMCFETRAGWQIKDFSSVTLVSKGRTDTTTTVTYNAVTDVNSDGAGEYHHLVSRVDNGAKTMLTFEILPIFLFEDGADAVSISGRAVIEPVTRRMISDSTSITSQTSLTSQISPSDGNRMDLSSENDDGRLLQARETTAVAKFATLVKVDPASIDQGSKLSAGAIAGIVIGAAIAIVGAALIVVSNRNKKSQVNDFPKKSQVNDYPRGEVKTHKYTDSFGSNLKA